MFKLTNSWFYCIKTSADGNKGLVTFKWCGGNYGVEDVDNNHNKFKIVKSGKYYISLTAYIESYEGGFFQLVLKREDKPIVSVQSDHEDDDKGFTGGGNVYEQNIWNLNSGDVLHVDITVAEKGSKLTTASVNIFRLP